MEVSTRSIRQGRKRTKTFTGCWTCRARKVKCDEARPRCRVCRDKCLACEGYGTRLQWLAPDTLSTSGRAGPRCELPAEASRTSSLRRQMPAEPPKSILSWSHVEGILRFIDSVESNTESSSPGQDVSVNVQNFGVFGRSCNSSGTPPETPHAIQPWSHHGSRDIVDDQDLMTDVLTPGSTEPTASPSYSAAAAAWDLCNLHERRSSLPPPDFSDQQSLVSCLIDPGRLAKHGKDNNGLPDEEGPATLQSPQESWNLAPYTPVSCPPPSPISSQDRFLLHHYMNRVVNLFCVIDNAKSPWKTIHLPRVLQCAGELGIVGSTSRIRNALRNALLSISAFYLSNDHRTHQRGDEAKKWTNIASRYRCDAIGLLKQGVEADVYSGGRPKYKEFLATMLSMITINVMSGDTSTCSVHLDGAGQLISHLRQRKSNFSRKAQALHRIYLYLRVIYESTAIRIRSGQGSRFSPFLWPQSTTLPTSPDNATPGVVGNAELTTSIIPMESAMDPLQDPAAEMATYECIYGIPQSLLMMLKEAIEIIDKVDGARAKSGSACIPETLAELCDNLEKTILDWPLEERLDRCCETNTGISAKIIYHQTRSFHNALIIYFSQNIRLLGYRYLRQYVEAVLDSIEAIEQIKAETKILAAPLFWPAFIGATEAFEQRHQERFRRWYEKVELYGIAAVRTGIQVVHEVWEQGPLPGRQLMSSWRRVVHRTGDSLMLT